MKKSTVVLFLLVSFSLHADSFAEELSWMDCVREAAMNHPQLISAQESLKGVKADKRITQSAVFPQVDASLSASTQEASGATTDSYAYGVSATQLLFDGSKKASDINSASENIKASEYNYRYTSSQVRFSLRTAFINLLKAQEQLGLAEEIYGIRRGNLELITLRYESGLEHKGALLHAEANLAQAKSDISAAERFLQTAQRELCKEMGRMDFSQIRVSGDFMINEDVTKGPDFDAMAEKNPYVARFAAARNSALFGVDSARAGYLPEVTASAGAGKSGAEFFPEGDRWSAGVSLSFPLFEGGLTRAAVDKARADYNKALADERDAKGSVLMALKRNWASLKDAIDAVNVRGKFLEAAKERAGISEAQYSLGLVGFDNWSIIEDDLVAAKKAFLAARAEASLAEAEWIQAKGEVLEYAKD